MTDLPQGWEWSTLGELAEVIQGQSPPGSSYNKNGVGIPFFQGKAEFGSLYPEVRKWTTNPLKSAQQDDILLSIRAPVGPTNLAPLDCSIGRGLAAIRAYEGCDQRYLLWALRASRDSLVAKATGSTFEAVTRKQLTAHPIPVPPLAEQRRIVAALEDYLRTIDTAQTALSTSIARLGRLHSLLLNRASAHHDTQRVTVSDVIREARGGWSRAQRHFVSTEDGIGYLKMNNLTPDGRLDLHAVTHVEATEQERGKYELRLDDVLFNNKNSEELVGKTALVDERVVGWLFNENLSRIRFTSDVLPGFAVIQMNSPHFRNSLASIRSASTNVSAIYMRDLKRLPFWAPPIPVQHKILEEHQSIMRTSNYLRNTLKRNIERASSLRRSLLTQTFAGRLVPQDSGDEPASELLGRIRVERAKAGPGRRARKAGPARPVQEELS